MASIKHSDGTPVVWADTTDYSSTVSGYTRTHQLNIENVVTGAARQGAKADLGATRARLYAVRVGIEWGTAPTAGNVVEIYWSGSVSATAGTGNSAGASGTDLAYKATEEAEWLKQAMLLGSLVATNDGAGTTQIQTVGYFTPPHRYGMPIVYNTSGQTFDGDAANHFVALVPLEETVA